MNIPNTIARNANSRRGSMRSASAAALAAVPTMLSRPPWRSRAYLRDDGRRCCRVLGAGLGVDADDDRHAGPQHLLGADLRRHADAHRNALHDLGEVAGRVVGRQQREHRARGRRHAFDRAGDGVAVERVDRDRHGLAGMQVGELRLLEVGVDVDVVERHEAGEALARLHIVAALHGAVADDAFERRADGGERQVALGLGERRLQLVAACARPPAAAP